MQKLIGLIGRKQAGKDTAADGLHAFGYVRIKFADHLKAMLNSLLWSSGCSATTRQGMIEGNLKDVPTEVLCGRTPRWAMQTLGTEWGRSLIHPDIWVRATINKTKQMKSKAVITDVRFPNEAQAIRDAGGILVLIIRPAQSENADPHPSETLIESLRPDFTVSNNGTIEELRASILTIARN